MRSFTQSAHLRATLASLALFGTLTIAGTAQAAPTPRRATAAKPVKKATLKNVQQFKPAQVSTALKSRLRGKPLMVTPREKAGEYAQAMKHSVEVMFMPNASSYGHLLIRVGTRIYDMPGFGGVRKQDFDSALRWITSPAYGFVYARSPKQIQTLQREFEAFANSNPKFSIAGTGPTSFSCAGFVTANLQRHAPELEVGLSAGAIGAAARLLRSGSHDAVTLYGHAASQAGSEDFKFLKLQ